METSLRNSNLYQQISDIQELTRKMSMPWMTAVESASKSLQSLNLDALSEAMRAYSSLTELYRIPESLVSSKLLRYDYEDGLSNDERQAISDATQQDVHTVVSYNTSVADVNKANQEYLEYLRTRTEEVASAIAHTEFEDGMDNDVTLLVKDFARMNKSATYNWLDELYSKNLNRSIVVEGILRTLAMITEKGDENILLPIVVAGLRSGVSAEQEAAIMVIEEWRTKECLDAIRSVHIFASDMIEDYAKMVADELEEELTSC